ncbi:MAG: diaminopimelate epimerase [Planctomycetota bacterium]|nr:diaminopimelate epimerase [Planctomycetota bacterium]MDA1212569.1 diaminopimelate epimerase [Planctomycetota bacterium]
MQFIKMQGAGNDYIYVDLFDQPTPADPAKLAVAISDRHFGVGGDGLIFIEPSTVADARMRMWNADGSEAEMCGNGIRCVARYLFESGRSDSETIRIETKRGVLTNHIRRDNGKFIGVSVEMGTPILKGTEIPTLLPGDPPIDVPLEAGNTFVVSVLSMGNPHCVIFGHEDLHFGRLIERHDAFPQRTNVEFVEVISPEECRITVWERGSGVTLACGTGACAVVVAGVLSGRLSRRVLCHMAGGDLQVEWKDDNTVWLTGPAEEVFRGEWPDSAHW